MKKSLTVLSLAFVLALVGLFPKGADALTLSPPRIDVSGDPGSVVTANLTVINDSKDQATYYSSFANFEAQGESGTPTIIPATDDLGTWMSVPASITLPPQGSENVIVSIAIPKDASPGGHFAAVFWGTQPDLPAGKQTGIGAKTGALVLLTVNGNIPESGNVLQFDTVSGKHFFTALPIDFFYRFENGGGDRIDPKGYIYMKDMAFITGAKIDGNPVDGNILPDSTRRFTVSWTGSAGDTGVVPKGFFAAVSYEFHNFAFGHYSAHLKLAYGTKGQMTDSVVGFWVFPWQLTLFVLVLALLLYLIIRAGIKHFEHWAVEEAEVMLKKEEAAKEASAK